MIKPEFAQMGISRDMHNAGNGSIIPGANTLPGLRPFIVNMALVWMLLALCGCQHHISITAPPPPPINPSDYSYDDYLGDKKDYKEAMTFGPKRDLDMAKQARNNIVYGLMGQIDVVYGTYYNQLFSAKNAMAIGSDTLSLGLSTAASIATHTATKTIFSALGTGLSGVSLSVDKNYFAQQTFPVIGIAMQTRRDKVKNAIFGRLALDTTTYPLLAAKRDLIVYLNAGTLASGLQELQEEAGVATANNAKTNDTNAQPAPSGLAAAAGDSQVTLVWTAPEGAPSFNVYWSTTKGVTITTGTKIPGVTASRYTHTGVTDGISYYYVVTAVNATGESAPSNEVSATPNAPVVSKSASAPDAPSGLSAVADNAHVHLLWTSPGGATSFNVYWSTSKGVTPATGTKIPGITASPYTHTGRSNGTPYYYVVTAVNDTGESAPSNEASATPDVPAHPAQILSVPH